MSLNLRASKLLSAEEYWRWDDVELTARFAFERLCIGERTQYWRRLTVYGLFHDTSAWWLLAWQGIRLSTCFLLWGSFALGWTLLQLMSQHNGRLDKIDSSKLWMFLGLKRRVSETRSVGRLIISYWHVYIVAGYPNHAFASKTGHYRQATCTWSAFPKVLLSSWAWINVLRQLQESLIDESPLWAEVPQVLLSDTRFGEYPLIYQA